MSTSTPNPWTGFTGQFIAGEWRPGKRGTTLIDTDPYDGSTLAEIAQADQSDLNEAYEAALQGAAQPTLPAFPATLGLCLMDGEVQLLIRKFPNGFVPGERQAIAELLGEFGVALGDANFLVLQRFVNHAGFNHAFDLLMGPGGAANPWDEDGTTLEQAFFWNDRSERAIP